ncbi:MAG: YybH family protein [Alphaproteobacteria bacterium]
MHTDRAFSAMSVEKGQGEAFLAHIADNARLFGASGEPTVGRQGAEAKYNSEAFRNSDEAKGTLSWEPMEAFVSNDGTLGWTNGHWTFRAPADAKGERRVSTGHYVTIWRRDKSGAWKVEADIGTVDPKEK